MYALTTFNHFSCAHALKGYDGACQTLHGHNYRLESRFIRESLDDLGMVYDFEVLRQRIQALLAPIDHRYLNELPMFQGLNPTVENVARWIYDTLSAALNTEVFRLESVRLWETDYAHVEYRPS